MPVTAWVNTSPGVVSGAPAATSGVVVNGASDSGGGTPPPTDGRIYPPIRA